MIKIGDFSKMGRVTVKALRHYDSCGLLKPVQTDEFSNYRYYAPHQLMTLHRIVMLKELGFTLAEIHQALTVEEHEFSLMLQNKKQQLVQEIERQQTRINRLENYLLETNMNKEQGMGKVIIIKEVPPFDAVTLKTTIPDYPFVGKLWAELSLDWGKYGVTQLEECFTIYYDEGYKEKNINVELVQQLSSITGDLPETAGGYKLEYRTIPAVKEMAILVHNGPFDTIIHSFAELGKWIDDNGYKICGPNREKYLIGPWCEDNPEKWQTEVQFPVCKR